MSLDDESPTQYFGPDAKLWKHPQTGHTLYLSPAQYERAEKRRLENEALAGKGKLLIPQADGSYAEFDLNNPKPAPPTSHPESSSFAEAVSKRYQESLWGKAPTSITVNLGTVEERLEQKRALQRLRAKAARGEILRFLPAFLFQWVLAIYVTAASVEPWSLGMTVSWTLVALESAWIIKLVRDWRKTVKRCEDLS